MTRIGTAYGASPLTFLSLAGVGDLFLTCSSPTSRNYTVGLRLGKGEKLDDIIRTLGSVAEGVTTAKGLKKIIDALGVSAPIATGVRNANYRWLRLRDGTSDSIIFFFFPSVCARFGRCTMCCMRVCDSMFNHLARAKRTNDHLQGKTSRSERTG